MTNCDCRHQNYGKKHALRLCFCVHWFLAIECMPKFCHHYGRKNPIFFQQKYFILWGVWALCCANNLCHIPWKGGAITFWVYEVMNRHIAFAIGAQFHILAFKMCQILLLLTKFFNPNFHLLNPLIFLSYWWCFLMEGRWNSWDPWYMEPINKSGRLECSLNVYTRWNPNISYFEVGWWW